MRRLVVVLIVLSVFTANHQRRASAEDAGAKDGLVPVGAAKLDITPDYPVRLSGYGSRRDEADSVAQRIWTKALAIGADDGDGPAVLVTVENCGMTPEIAGNVARRLQEHTGVKRERLVVSVTHTHAAPCLTNWAPFLFGETIPPEHQAHIDRYTRELTDKMVDVATAALSNRRGARLFWAQGSAGFAANRRAISDGRWTGFGVQPDGPVDHSLPIIAAKDTEGKPIAVVANYACHCTTLGGDFNQVAGDWAGFAQEYIEQEHEGAVAIITIGCGADANPEPRGKFDMCRQQGRAVADEVCRLVAEGLTPLSPKLQCRLTHVDLPFDTLPTKAQWQERASQGGATAYHAQQFLQRIEEGETIPTKLSYPIACWTFADDLAMVFLAGEVVVDYAVRLKAEFDADRLWITAFSNDVPCYIPTKRILREGGYEAEYSMIYYARPTRFAEQVENTVLDAVANMVPPGYRASR